MKAIVITALFTFVAATAAWFTNSGVTGKASEHTSEAVTTAESTAVRQPVLVELFTSEGCSSCPPADRVLTNLQRDQGVAGAEIITLAFHVDYWNYLGWKDRFSTAAFTRRQEAYARQFGNSSSYTPQMVVDGSLEFVGSNTSKALTSVSTSSAHAKASIDLALKGNNLSATISGLPSHSNATVFLAVAESSLFTKVGGGENSGSLLEHTSVVRDLIPLGTVNKGESQFNAQRQVAAKPDWKSENMKYVVFVQEDSTLKVLAVKQISR